MTTRNHTATALTLSSLAGLALAVGPTQAATIYSETFSGTGDLNGTAPDVTTGGAIWTASDWQKDGTIADQGVTHDNAWLPFTPQSGFVYTLTVAMDAVASGTSNGSWTALGFANGSNTVIDFWQNDAAPWALYRATETPDQIVSFSGPGVGGVNSAHGTVAGPVTLSIVLDTTGAQWTAEWFEGTNSLRTHTYTTNPTITTVGFGRNNDSDGPVSSFSLSGVPEPSCAALLGLGGLALLRRRRQ